MRKPIQGFEGYTYNINTSGVFDPTGKLVPWVNVFTPELKRAPSVFIRKTPTAVYEYVTEEEVKTLINSMEQQPVSVKPTFIIGSVSTDHFGKEHFSFSPNPATHSTREAANKEIERLAQSVPGKKFTLFELKATCMTGGLVWNS